MKSLIILIACVLGICAISCSNSVNTVRAVDVLTNVPLAVEVDTTIYNTGDTVWVHVKALGKSSVLPVTHLSSPNDGCRLFVLDY